MSKEQSTATLLQKILIAALIVANVCVAAFVWFQHQSRAAQNKEIPRSALISEEAIQSHLHALSVQSPSGNAVVALLGSASTNCTTGKLVEILKNHAQRAKSSKFLILLPYTFTSDDLNNFRTNLGVEFTVERADERLSKLWLSLAAKYEATGVAILSSRDETLVLQDVNEIDRRLYDFN